MVYRTDGKDEIDLDAIAREVKSSCDLLEVASDISGVKFKRSGSKRRHAALCPFHQEKTPSFYVRNHDDGGQTYRCYGCGAKGDVISFVMSYKNLSFARAVDYLMPGLMPARRRRSARNNGNTETSVKRYSAPSKPDKPDERTKWKAIVPVPAHAAIYPTGFDRARGRSAPIHNPTSEDRPVTSLPITLLHPYRDGRGDAYGYVIRSDFKDMKITPFVQWGVHEDGTEGWFISDFSPANRLPYGYDKFVAAMARREATGAPVIVLAVEGEKTCDAAEHLYRDLVVLSWPQGTQNVGAVDWSFLGEADMVVLGPDNDDQGRAAMAFVAIEAMRHGQKYTYCMGPVAADKGADLADIPVEDMDYARHLLKTAGPAAEVLAPWIAEIVDASSEDNVQRPALSDTEGAPCP